MSDLKKLKFVQAGYETYTGPIGMYQFVEGLSVEPITRAERDRLSTAFQFAEVDADGVEIEAGVAARLVADSAARMATPNLARQTEAEKSAEDLRTLLQAQAPQIELLTRAQLEELAGKHGIKGLRQMVGDKWGVKNRSIPLLIDEILVAQNNWVQLRNEKIEAATKIEAPAEPKVTDTEGLSDEQLAAAAAGDDGVDLEAELAKDKMTAAELAAATGNLGASISQETEDDELPEGIADFVVPLAPESAPAGDAEDAEADAGLGQD